MNQKQFKISAEKLNLYYGENHALKDINMKTHKLSIVGVGHVGSAVLEKAVSVGLFSTISLVVISPP